MYQGTLLSHTSRSRGRRVHKFPLSAYLFRKKKEKKGSSFSSALTRQSLGFLPLNNPMEEQMGALLRCQNGV